MPWWGTRYRWDQLSDNIHWRSCGGISCSVGWDFQLLVSFELTFASTRNSSSREQLLQQQTSGNDETAVCLTDTCHDPGVRRFHLDGTLYMSTVYSGWELHKIFIVWTGQKRYNPITINRRQTSFVVMTVIGLKSIRGTVYRRSLLPQIFWKGLKGAIMQYNSCNSSP